MLNAEVKLKKLAREKFACEADARKELIKISKEFKYHRVDNVEVREKISD